MRVNGLGSNASQFIGPKKAEHTIENKGDVQAQSTSEGQPLTPEGDKPQQGVVRLLQEGHFKGVADVRLRINFFDELNEVASAQAQSVSEDEIDNVVESVKDGVMSYPESGDLTEEDIGAALETFEQVVNQTKADFLAAEAPSEDSLVSELRLAFDTLLSSFTVPEQTNPAESGEAESASDPSEPADAMADFIAELTSVFESALEGLIHGIRESRSLPALSEPKGHGGAYEKFLAIYSQLQGNDTSEETSPPEEAIDVIV